MFIKFTRDAKTPLMELARQQVAPTCKSGGFPPSPQCIII